MSSIEVDSSSDTSSDASDTTSASSSTSDSANNAEKIPQPPSGKKEDSDTAKPNQPDHTDKGSSAYTHRDDEMVLPLFCEPEYVIELVVKRIDPALHRHTHYFRKSVEWLLQCIEQQTLRQKRRCKEKNQKFKELVWGQETERTICLDVRACNSNASDPEVRKGPGQPLHSLTRC